MTSRPNLLLPILATSWFWLFGLIVVSGLPVFAKDVLFANEQVVTMMLALFAVGVGLGSILAEKLLHGEVSARFVPIAAVFMAGFAIDLHLSSANVLETRNLATISTFLSRPGSWRIMLDLVGVAMAGGLFTVPLYAILQHESEPSHRARVIAANNVINALAMTVATVVAGILSRRLTMGELFAVCGFTTLPVAVYSAWVVRRSLFKSVMRVILRLLYRVEVEGLEHARAAMPHAVIAANHASFLDGLLLGAFLPGDPIFAVDTFIAKKWYAKPFLAVVNAFPVDPTNPLSIRAMIRAVEAGSACIIFPEGRITTTGGLMKVYEGPAVIAERTKAALVMVRIDGAEFTPFSRLAGKVRQRWFPRLRIRDSPTAAPDVSRGHHRPGAPRGVAPRASRRDGAVDVCDRANRDDALRCAARGAPAAWRQSPDCRRHRVHAAVVSRPDHGKLCPRRRAGEKDQSWRTRRCAASHVARGSGHVLRPSGGRPRAGDVELLDRPGRCAVGMHSRGDQAGRHRAEVRREGQARADGDCAGHADHRAVSRRRTR